MGLQWFAYYVESLKRPFENLELEGIGESQFYSNGLQDWGIRRSTPIGVPKCMYGLYGRCILSNQA